MKSRLCQFYRNTSLKQKMQLLFILVSVGNLFFLFILINSWKQELDQYALENDNEIVDSAIDVIEAEIANINSLSKLLINDSECRKYMGISAEEAAAYSRDVQLTLYRYATWYDFISSVYIFREDDNYLSAQIKQTRVKGDVVKSPLWKEPMDERKGKFILSYCGNGAFVQRDQDPVLSLMRAVYDIESQEKTGYQVINLKFDFFEKAFQGILNDDSLLVRVQDKEGNIYIQKASMDIEIDRPQGQCCETVRAGGITFSYIKKEILNGDMEITFVREHRSLALGHYGEAIWLGGYLLFSVFCWLVLHRFITVKVTVPIEKLVSSMEQVQEGWLKRVSAKTDNDEIGHLKDGYNAMLIEINNLVEDLQNKESEKYRLEINAMQEQIKPHFLYNTLYTIEYMALKNGDRETYDAVQTLGSFYKNFLSKGEQEILISQEIKIVSDYLKLQSLRYSSIFEGNITVEENLESCYVLKLILQPLVENCIYHGIRPKGEFCRIDIKVESCGEFIRFHVFDTGIGMNNEKIESIMENRERKSFGVYGTIERLKLFYQREDVCEIRSSEGEYTEVVVKIPLRRVKKDEG